MHYATNDILTANVSSTQNEACTYYIQHECWELQYHIMCKTSKLSRLLTKLYYQSYINTTTKLLNTAIIRHG